MTHTAHTALTALTALSSKLRKRSSLNAALAIALSDETHNRRVRLTEACYAPKAPQHNAPQHNAQ